jgi:formyl-CoA transferase
MLGWLGADVIKIEPPGGAGATHGVREHRARRLVLPDAEQHQESHHARPQSPEGRAILKKMVERADVLIENLAPVVRAPSLAGRPAAHQSPEYLGVIKELQPYRPVRNYKSFEMIAQAMGGAMSVTAWPMARHEGRGGLGDTGAGLHLAMEFSPRSFSARPPAGQRIEVAQRMRS